MFRSTFFITTIFIIIAAATRLLPHPANFTPILAISLFAGAYLSNRTLAALIPVAAMFIADIFLGFHNLMLPIYALMVALSFAGRGLQENRTPLRIGGFTLAGSLVFFLVTNFLVWMTSGMYALNIAGLIQCYTMAIPFFQNQLAGDLFFSVVLFGSMHLLALKAMVPAEAKVRI